VIPDDIKSLAAPVLNHRVIRTTDAELADESVSAIIDEMLADVTPPSADTTFAETDEQAVASE
jgi:MoxR-like ATPase